MAKDKPSREDIRDYARHIRKVGLDHFGPGLKAAQEDYKKEIEPYLEVISKLTLPKRSPVSPRHPHWWGRLLEFILPWKRRKRADRNYQRVTAIGKALHSKRLELLKGEVEHEQDAKGK